MHIIAQGALQAADTARVLLAVLAIIVVAFWRILLRMALALIAVAVLVAVGTGIVTLVDAAHP